MQRGNASTPPNSLKSTHLPSITGIPASGPISPRPRTAVPSVITAHKFPLLVRLYDSLMSSLIARQGSATPGVYARAKSVSFSTLTLEWISIFPCFSLCNFNASLA